MGKNITPAQTEQVGKISRAMLMAIFNVREDEAINSHMSLCAPDLLRTLITKALPPRDLPWRTFAEDRRTVGIQVSMLADKDATVVADRVINYKKSLLGAAFERQIALAAAEAGGIKADDKKAIAGIRGALKSAGMTEVSDLLARGLLHNRV